MSYNSTFSVIDETHIPEKYRNYYHFPVNVAIFIDAQLHSFRSKIGFEFCCSQKLYSPPS